MPTHPMLICSAKTIRAWDQWTIEQEPIPSIALMERAARVCTHWILDHFPPDTPLTIFCGPGNNGGDGLAIARLLAEMNRTPRVFYLDNITKASPDNLINQQRLAETGLPLYHIDAEEDIPDVSGEWCIDALFGSGLTRPTEAVAARLIRAMNHQAKGIIAIDIPSGMFSDQTSSQHPIVTATHTLSFQCLKPAFLMAENGKFMGQVHVLDIGLQPDFPDLASPEFIWNDRALVMQKYRPPDAFAHKGTRGHAALLAGSWGMAGAAMLAGEACLRSGCGKLTIYTDSRTYPMLQTALPEAIYAIQDSIHDRSEHLSSHSYESIGAGPGWGIGAPQEALLHELFGRGEPVVLDADALNTIAQYPDLLMNIPAGSIITPHPKEFDRIFGQSRDEFDRLRIAREKARNLHLNILLKGHRSFLVTPEGKVFVNASGNPGMATAGSGDVLTGVLTGLLAQGLPPSDAMVLGAWLHGHAGDLAAMALGQESMLAGDIVRHLGKAFISLRH
jgi:ADP-dependent NAD(P)H-hydrate dehydratase / NAD(P)H-hydrate epimerase